MHTAWFNKYYKIESVSGYKPYFVRYVGAEDILTVGAIPGYGFKKLSPYPVQVKSEAKQ